MDIKLPDITVQSEWTEASQLKKIAEEFGEVCEALMQGDPINTVREALDTMQTCKTLISMVQKEWNIDIDMFLKEHVEKLERKGYLKEGEEWI